MNGVIQTSTGDLLRAGYHNLSLEDVFDGATESYRTDIPVGSFCKGAPESSVYKRWNGSLWVDVVQIALSTSVEPTMIKSPNGTIWKMSVDNNGIISTKLA